MELGRSKRVRLVRRLCLHIAVVRPSAAAVAVAASVVAGTADLAVVVAVVVASAVVGPEVSWVSGPSAAEQMRRRWGMLQLLLLQWLERRKLLRFACGFERILMWCGVVAASSPVEAGGLMVCRVWRVDERVVVSGW